MHILFPGPGPALSTPLPVSWTCRYSFDTLPHFTVSVKHLLSVLFSLLSQEGLAPFSCQQHLTSASAVIPHQAEVVLPGMPCLPFAFQPVLPENMSFCFALPTALTPDLSTRDTQSIHCP